LQSITVLSRARLPIRHDRHNRQRLCNDSYKWLVTSNKQNQNTAFVPSTSHQPLPMNSGRGQYFVVGLVRILLGLRLEKGQTYP